MQPQKNTPYELCSQWMMSFTLGFGTIFLCSMGYIVWGDLSYGTPSLVGKVILSPVTPYFATIAITIVLRYILYGKMKKGQGKNPLRE